MDTVRAVRELPFPLSPEQIKSCAYQFNIHSRGETDIEIDEIGGTTVLLRSSSADALERDFQLLVGLVEAARASARSSRARAFFKPLSPSDDRRYHRPAELLASDAFRHADGGRLALRGPAAELYYALDGAFLGLARRTGAEAFHAEPTWREGDLEAFGYTKESPFLFRVAHLGDSEPSIWQNAVCDNLWKHNAGLVVAGAPRVFTARGTCCRHEGKQHFSLEYLRAFTMREVAAAGSPEVMERFRDEALAFIEPLVADLGLSGFLEDANDPFFLGGAALDHEGRPPSLPELPKIELRLQLYDGKSLACTSFNIHGDFFARSFRYCHEDGRTPVWTGCVAFGLERWVWAILVQHGPDPARWPPRLRALAGL